MANYLDETGLLKLWSKIKTYVAGHTGNKNNPHAVSKSQVGLGDVENKSSATIRGEITSSNVINALGYTPISKSGGTLDGTALFEFADSGNWNNGSSPSYPVVRGGFRWVGQSDAVKLYAEETARDNLELVLLFTDDNSNGLTIKNTSGQAVARITANGNFSGSFTGDISGNASSANSVPWSGVTGKPSTYTPSAHTHNYAGSSSAGGSANSAVKLDTATAGSATQPVYFSGGKPTACTYTLGKSVPSNAVFTDTNTWRGIQNNLTSTSTDQSLSAAQGKILNDKITSLQSGTKYCC